MASFAQGGRGQVAEAVLDLLEYHDGVGLGRSLEIFDQLPEVPGGGSGWGRRPDGDAWLHGVVLPMVTV